MIRPQYPFPSYPPVMIPDPEILQKYGTIAVRLLRLAKNKAMNKGREHKQILKEFCK